MLRWPQRRCGNTIKSKSQSKIRAPALLPRQTSKTRYTIITNLEDTPKHSAPFAIERSGGVILTSSFLSAASYLAVNRIRATDLDRAHPQLANLLQYQEFTMSARNGDKSRFNRERKQKIARRKRSHELLKAAAGAVNSGKTTVRAQPRPVTA